jgi:hypothetical protein
MSSDVVHHAEFGNVARIGLIDEWYKLKHNPLPKKELR